MADRVCPKLPTKGSGLTGSSDDSFLVQTPVIWDVMVLAAAVCR